MKQESMNHWSPESRDFSREEVQKATKLRIKNAIEGLTKVPPKGDIKQMQGFNPPLYRLRIGKYRVLYEYININGEQTLIVKDIGSRGDIYK